MQAHVVSKKMMNKLNVKKLYLEKTILKYDCCYLKYCYY